MSDLRKLRMLTIQYFDWSLIIELLYLLGMVVLASDLSILDVETGVF